MAARPPRRIAWEDALPRVRLRWGAPEAWCRWRWQHLPLDPARLRDIRSQMWSPEASVGYRSNLCLSKSMTSTRIHGPEHAGDMTSRKQAEEVLLKAGRCNARSSTAPISPASPPTRRASFRSSTWRRTDAGLHGGRGDEQDHSRGHLRSPEVIARAKALSDELGSFDYARLRGIGVQGLARHRGHL